MAKALSEYKPVYLIFGEQEMLLDAALDQLKRSVGEVADLDFNMETFDGESADSGQIISACNTLPFASERRLVVVTNVDKMNKERTDALVAYVANPAPMTILALVAKKIAKNTRLYKSVDKLGGLIAREAPKAAEYPQRVRDMFARKGRSITLDGAELLVNAAGRDLRRLSVEVDKAVAFAGDRVDLTDEDIRQVTATTAKTSVFEFVTSVAERDCGSALRLVNRLLGDGESVFGLHALALRQIRDLIVARALVDRGAGSTSEIARAIGRPDWQVRNLARQARGFTSAELTAALRGAAEADAQMKTSRDSRLVFERWIVEVCA
jgi:DNA polymerase III subunit delta